MGYCVQNGNANGDIMPTRVSLTQLQQLTSEDGLSVVQTVIDEAISNADELINSYCAKKYVVPFNPIPQRITNLSADLAKFYIYKKRSDVFGNELQQSIRDLYTDSLNFLKDVAIGKAVIEGAVIPPANPITTGGSFSANKRHLTQHSLNKL